MSIAHLAAPASPLRRLTSPQPADGTAVSLDAHCSTCLSRALCLPAGLGLGDLALLDDLRFGRRRVQAGQLVYHAGDAFEFIYAVRRGTFKTSLTLADGREQVSAFCMAGEPMGLDGEASGTHGSSATALEDGEVCSIPYGRLSELSAANTGMQHMVSRLMSREIVREHSLMLLLGSMNAEERLAAFLLNLSQRYAARGYSAREFHLRMSRADIGSYLGMKVETVSRTFSAFQQQHLLEVDKRHIRITDMAGLARAIETRMN